eukprot:13251024-Alexandrium_andersonii.AAC.1
MSASLVGSEMCIRDSAPHAARPQPLPGRAGATAGPQEYQSRVQQWLCSTCLLYTSDAADDM